MSELNVAPEEPEVDVAALEGAENADATEEVEASSQDEQEETAASDDADKPEKPKRRSRAEERINELTREKYEAQRNLEAMQRQMAELQQRMQPQMPETGEPMPQLSQYGYDEERYTQAVQQWHQNQMARIAQQQEQMRQQQAYQAEQMRQQQVLSEKIQKGVEKYPDFTQKVNDPRLPPLREVNPVAFQAVLESDAAHDVAYYLASNPQEIYRFASMTPTQAVREVTLIEAKLKAAPPREVRNPPKPPSTVGGSGAEAMKDPDKMTTEEWLAWRNRQIQSKR